MSGATTTQTRRVYSYSSKEVFYSDTLPTAVILFINKNLASEIFRNFKSPIYKKKN